MNKLLYILTLLFLVLSCKSNKQEKSLTESNIYTRIGSNTTYGFVNQAGDTIIPLNKYKFLNPIDEEGMILAQSNTKWGYINIKQDTLIPFIYDDLGVFSKELAPAKQNGRYGFIDRKGKVVIPFKYETQSYFYKCKLAYAKLNGRYGFIDQSGNEIIPIQFENVSSNKIDSFVCAMQNGKWAFFSCSGKQLTEFKFDKITESYYDDRNYTYFKRGLCRVTINGKIGYINEKFNEIVPFGEYQVGKPFRNYLAIVAKNEKYGIIDTLGNFKVPLEYDFIEHPIEYSNESNLFAIKKGKYFQFLDKFGNPITDFDIKQYEWDSYKGKESYQRYFVLTNSSGMAGTISDRGIKEIPFKYQQIDPFNGKRVTYAKKNGKYGLIDYQGKEVLPFEYDNIYFSSYFIVSKSGFYGIVDENGKQVLPISYQSISPVFYDSKNRFIVKQNGFFGIIDRDKNVIIPLEYDEISNWVEYGPKEHFITKNGKKGLISREGRIIIPPQYDEIWVDNTKLIKVKRNELYGTIDWKNKIVHPIKYEEILWEWPYFTRKPLDTVYLKENGKYFSTDINGKIIDKNVSNKLIDKKFGYILNYE